MKENMITFWHKLMQDEVEMIEKRYEFLDFHIYQRTMRPIAQEGFGLCLNQSPLLEKLAGLTKEDTVCPN